MKILLLIALMISFPNAAMAEVYSGNARAGEIVAVSPSVQKAYMALKAATDDMDDRKLASATFDGLELETCITHRADLNDKDKQAIVATLIAQGWLIPAENLMEGVFPPVIADGSNCPHLPQPIYAARAAMQVATMTGPAVWWSTKPSICAMRSTWLRPIAISQA